MKFKVKLSPFWMTVRNPCVRWPVSSVMSSAPSAWAYRLRTVRASCRASEVVVEWQMNAYLDTSATVHSASCATKRLTPRRVSHGVRDMPVESPRFTHCPCRAHETESFQSAAELLPERTTPGTPVLGNQMGLAVVVWYDRQAIAGCTAFLMNRLSL